jgi:hypothetical protein
MSPVHKPHVAPNGANKGKVAQAINILLLRSKRQTSQEVIVNSRMDNVIFKGEHRENHYRSGKLK